MAFIATPNGIEVVLRATQNAVPIVNVYHVDNGASPSTSDLTAVAEIFESWWQDNLQAAHHTSYVLHEIVAKDISVINGPEVVINLTTDNAGLSTGAAMAANGAAVISWRTAQTGRSFRGRTYLGGLANAVLDDAQTISLASAAGFAGAFQELLDALASASKTLCVLSKYALGVARVAGLLTEIISIVVDTKLDSQRRRTAN